MNDIDARLARCFKAVLPDIPAAQLADATAETAQAWDSVALVSLLNLVSEEFDLEVDWENAGELTSYAAIRNMILSRTATR